MWLYFHVKKDVRKKLEPTAKLGIFVGYTDTPHNYQVYLLTSRMTFVRRDVKFDDQKAMCASLEREIQLHEIEELLVHKIEETQFDVEKPHVEDLGVETSTQEESSRDGRKCMREEDKLLSNARDNVGAPRSQ